MTQSYAPTAELEPVPLEKCAYTLSIVLGVFAAYAWLARGGVWEAIGAWAQGERVATLSQMTPLFIVFAVLSLVLQISSNVAAAAARQAIAFDVKGDMRQDIGRAQMLMVAGGFYNMFSLHHAVAFTGVLGFEWWAEPLAWAIGFVLAGYEPGQYWVDRSLRVKLAERRAQADAAFRAEQAERNERVHQQTLERIEASKPTQAPANDQTAPQSSVQRRGDGPGRTASKVIMGATAASGVAADAAARDVHLPVEQAAHHAPAHAGVDPQVARALALRDQGKFRREVADEMGVSERTVTRLWKKGEEQNRAVSAPPHAPDLFNRADEAA